MKTFIVYFLNEDGSKEKIIAPALDSFDAEQIILRHQPLKVITHCVLSTDAQPDDAEEYTLT